MLPLETYSFADNRIMCSASQTSIRWRPCHRETIDESEGGALIGFSLPGILPRSRDVLIVPSEPDIGAGTVAEFQRLVLGDGGRDCTANARVRLLGEWILHPVHRRFATEPIIAVERDPQTGLEVVAQVAFKGPNRAL